MCEREGCLTYCWPLRKDGDFQSYLCHSAPNCTLLSSAESTTAPGVLFWWTSSLRASYTTFAEARSPLKNYPIGDQFYGRYDQLEKIAHIYGDVCIKKKEERRKRQKLLLSEMLYDYAQNSTLHGLRYIVDRSLSVVEKLFWFSTVVVSLVLCSMYIRDTYNKWVTTPVIVTVNERLASVGTVPFPSVTICPEAKMSADKYNYEEMSDKYFRKRLSEQEIEKFVHINALCKYYVIARNETPSIWTDSSMIADITEVAITHGNMFFNCRWNNSFSKCSDFRLVYTSVGVCYTANALAAADIFENTTQNDYPYLDSNIRQVGWSLENGYNYSVRNPYPKRGRDFGNAPDMEIEFIHDAEVEDEECNLDYRGYRIYLHHPADLPQATSYYYSVIPDQVTSLAISLHALDSDSSISKYKPEVRQCYFPEDKKLRYFKIYTIKNCEAECLSNYTFARCGCVGFYMPHDNSSQICNTYRSATHDCLETANDFMSEEEKKANIGERPEGCRCLPACNAVEYDAEVLKAPFIMPKSSPFKAYFPLRSHSYLKVFYKKPYFVAMQRRELFGLTDLLANTGGLLGLFLGFSFLSLVEIFYFLTLRVGCTLRRDLKEEKEKKKSDETDVHSKQLPTVY